MQEPFTKINDEFFDLSDIPINKNENVEKAAESELIDEPSITDRYEVYRAKLPNMDQEIPEGNTTTNKEQLVQAEYYKTYKIYKNPSLSNSQSQVMTGFSGQFTRESIESAKNEKNPVVQNLIKDSDEQITMINKMLEEQRKKKSFQNEIQSDDDEEKANKAYLNKKLIYIGQEKMNYSLLSQREESLEHELWTSKSANDRLGQEYSGDSQANLLEIKTASDKEKTAADKEKSASTSLEGQNTGETAERGPLPDGSRSRSMKQHGKATSASSFSKYKTHDRNSSTSTTREKSYSLKDRSSKSRDKLPIEERLKLQDQAREARLENLRRMKELAEAAELRDRPEISKNSKAIVKKSEKFRKQVDIYQRCVEFQREKELINMTKQNEKIAETEAECTHQPEINPQSRHLHRQIDSLFQWNERKMRKHQELQHEKDQRELEELRHMQRKTFSCEGTRRILQEKGSRSNEPVEKRLINQGLRLENKLNAIRNKELQDKKTAVPKINKNSEKMLKLKGHTSLYQRLAGSLSSKTKGSSEESGLFNFDQPDKRIENSGDFNIEAHNENNTAKSSDRAESRPLQISREGKYMSLNDKSNDFRPNIESVQEYYSPKQEIYQKSLRMKHSESSNSSKLSHKESFQKENMNSPQANYFAQGKFSQVQVMENNLQALQQAFHQESNQQEGKYGIRTDETKVTKKGYKAIRESRNQAAKELKYKSQAPKLGIAREEPVSEVIEERGRAGRPQGTRCNEIKEISREKHVPKQFNLDLNDLISPTVGRGIQACSTKSNATQLEYSLSHCSSFTKASPQSYLSSIQMRQNKIFASGKDGKLLILDKGLDIRSPALKEFEVIISNREESVEASKTAEADAVARRNLAWLNSKKAKLEAMAEIKMKDELTECTFKPALYSPETDWKAILQPRLKVEQVQETQKTYMQKCERFAEGSKHGSEKNLRILDQNSKVSGYSNVAGGTEKRGGNWESVKPKTQESTIPRAESKENFAHPYATMIKSAFSPNARPYSAKFAEAQPSNLRTVR